MGIARRVWTDQQIARREREPVVGPVLKDETIGWVTKLNKRRE